MKTIKKFITTTSLTLSMILIKMNMILAEGEILVDKDKFERATDPVWLTILYFVSKYAWYAMITAYIILGFKYNGDEDKDRNKTKYIVAAIVIFVVGSMLINIDKFADIFINKGKY